MLERVPDRFLTPRVARAIMSPSAILLAGAGASLGILIAGPGLTALALAAAAWAARVAVAVPRRSAGERIDPFAIGEPWRRFVQEALQAQARYQRAVRDTQPGPLRERLDQIGERIDTGVRECWRIARRGDDLDDALGTLDVSAARRELQAIEGDAAQGWAAGSNLERTAEALRAQLASADRMAAVVRDARDRLRLLDARLDEAVARAVELSVSAGDAADAGDIHGLGSDVDRLVDEMEALRSALEETGQGPATATG